MNRKRQNPKERLLVTGTLLLLLLLTGVAITGQIINRMAAEMSGRIVTQIGEYHYHQLRTAFGKGGKALEIASGYLTGNSAAPENELRVVATTLLAANPELERIWFLVPDRGVLSFRSLATTPAVAPAEADSPGPAAAENGSNRVSGTDDSPLSSAPMPVVRERSVPQDMIPAAARAALESDTLWSGIVLRESERSWCLIRRITDRNRITHLCGAELPLQRMHACMAEQNPFSRSYATVFTPDGRIVYHPEKEIIGTRTRDSITLRLLREVTATGRERITGTISDYLGVQEERIYYPLDASGVRWVAGIGIPRLTIEQQISDFHFYTILTAVISVLFFAALLVLAQRRWLREYKLRQESERESEKLHLQQVIEQIDPHFLFNSLNSLYALIRTDTEQARTFTLTLSRVYRHVLERRHEILSTLSDEIDFTWQYYSLQKIRFGERIVLTIAVDPVLRNHRIPSMSLQTLVENAVKHNRITASNPLRIRIVTDKGGLVIENNFTPRPDGDSESLGTGLERIRAVYRFYTEENITIDTVQQTFRCRLPLLPPLRTED